MRAESGSYILLWVPTTEIITVTIEKGQQIMMMENEGMSYVTMATILREDWWISSFDEYKWQITQPIFPLIVPLVASFCPLLDHWLTNHSIM